MVILGIESTAHTFGVAVVDGCGEILSNVKDSYTTDGGGMIPLEVREHHKNVADDLYKKALDEAGVLEKDIDAVAFSNAPGLAPCLLEGMEFVKKIAGRLGIPVVCVNHCVAHLEIGETVGARDPVMLYASGANTQVIAYEAGKYRVFGETLDLGVGNFIDTVGRFMGLGFPAGPKIEKMASEYAQVAGRRSQVADLLELSYSVKGMDATSSRCQVSGVRCQPELIDLSYSVKGMDVSFSGMQTKIRNLIEKGVDKKWIAYSMQEVVFGMLVEVAERALAHTGKKELLLGGGVACNSRLQEMCRIMCEERGGSALLKKRFAKETKISEKFSKETASPKEDFATKEGVRLFVPPRDLLVDNAGMIGYLGLKMFKVGLGISCEDLDIFPRERTDDVICDSWR